LIFSESCDKRYAHEIEQAGSEFQWFSIFYVFSSYQGQN
jgi:hypothetical protein